MTARLLAQHGVKLDLIKRMPSQVSQRSTTHPGAGTFGTFPDIRASRRSPHHAVPLWLLLEPHTLDQSMPSLAKKPSSRRAVELGDFVRTLDFIFIRSPNQCDAPSPAEHRRLFRVGVDRLPSGPTMSTARSCLQTVNARTFSIACNAGRSTTSFSSSSFARDSSVGRWATRVCSSVHGHVLINFVISASICRAVSSLYSLALCVGTRRNVA